jgi:hypothetical protein
MNGWWEILQVVIGVVAVAVLLLGFGNALVKSGRRSAVRDATPELTAIDDVSEQQARVHCASDEAVDAAHYAMALAAHDPSFSPSAPVSPFDGGGPAGFGM